MFPRHLWARIMRATSGAIKKLRRDQLSPWAICASFAGRRASGVIQSSSCPARIAALRTWSMLIPNVFRGWTLYCACGWPPSTVRRPNGRPLCVSGRSCSPPMPPTGGIPVLSAGRLIRLRRGGFRLPIARAPRSCAKPRPSPWGGNVEKFPCCSIMARCSESSYSYPAGSAVSFSGFRR